MRLQPTRNAAFAFTDWAPAPADWPADGAPGTRPLVPSYFCVKRATLVGAACCASGISSPNAAAKTHNHHHHHHAARPAQPARRALADGGGGGVVVLLVGACSSPPLSLVTVVVVIVIVVAVLYVSAYRSPSRALPFETPPTRAHLPPRSAHGRNKKACMGPTCLHSFTRPLPSVRAPPREAYPS